MLKIGNFAAKQDDNGTWIYKALAPTFFKKNGVLRKKYHDLPRYKVIPVYEDAAKDLFELEMAKAVKDMTDKLKSFVIDEDLEKGKRYEMVTVHRGSKVFQRKQLVGRDELYHVTRNYKIADIINDGSLKANGQSGVSLTRDDKYNVRDDRVLNVRLVFDRQKIKHNTKLKQIGAGPNQGLPKGTDPKLEREERTVGDLSLDSLLEIQITEDHYLDSKEIIEEKLKDIERYKSYSETYRNGTAIPKEYQDRFRQQAEDYIEQLEVLLNHDKLHVLRKKENENIKKARGKVKKIGELDKSGRNIKTAQGWVPVKKSHKKASPKNEEAIHNKLLYHGSSKDDITEFDPLKMVRSLDSVGTWFTDSKEKAKDFARHVKKEDYPKSHPGRIYEAKITIKNPWVLQGDEGFDKYVKTFLHVTGLKHPSLAKKEDVIKFRNYLKKGGKDGIIMTGLSEANGSTYYVAFDNEQIEMERPSIPGEYEEEQHNITKDAKIRHKIPIVRGTGSADEAKIPLNKQRPIRYWSNDPRIARTYGPITLEQPQSFDHAYIWSLDQDGESWHNNKHIVDNLERAMEMVYKTGKPYKMDLGVLGEFIIPRDTDVIIIENVYDPNDSSENVDAENLHWTDFHNIYMLPNENYRSKNLLKDASGKPITFYHGTSKEGEASIRKQGFDPKRGRFGTTTFSFMSKKKLTNAYNKGGLIEANVYMDNPMDSEKNFEIREKVVKDLTGKEMKDLTTEDWIKHTNAISRGFLKEARKQGYDGVYDPTQPEIVVFDEQNIEIKDA